MPEGWWNSFGEQMCQEIQDEVDGWTDEELEWFDITVKEKYGELRIYCSNGNDTLDKIFYKYETLARHTCIGCGAPAHWISNGWISPWCDDCARARYDNNMWKGDFKFEDEYIDINEYYKPYEEED